MTIYAHLSRELCLLVLLARAFKVTPVTAFSPLHGFFAGFCRMRRTGGMSTGCMAFWFKEACVSSSPAGQPSRHFGSIRQVDDSSLNAVAGRLIS